MPKTSQGKQAGAYLGFLQEGWLIELVSKLFFIIVTTLKIKEFGIDDDTL